MSHAPLLRVESLHVSFRTRIGWLPAVRGVDLDLARGEALGIVGESGSGKSATALAMLGLLGRDARVAGSVKLDGTELIGMRRAELRRVRAARIGIVFQDPQSSLNPVLTVGTQIVETLRAHLPMDRAEAHDRALELLRLVELPDPAGRLRAYPHQLSGGMRQRVMIAIALACRPDVLIADEPTTALDVTVQAQLLDTLDRMRAELGMAVVLITHDLGVVNRICDRMAVMYGGRVVEEGAVRDVLDGPEHPYTQALLDAQPHLAGEARAALRTIDGAPPSLHELAAGGCTFAPRCPRALDACLDEMPQLAAGRTPARRRACLNPVPA